MVGAGHNLLQIILQQTLVIEMHRRQRGEADDGVHGRANIMGHAVEEGGLGFVGMLGSLQSNACLAFGLLGPLEQN